MFVYKNLNCFCLCFKNKLNMVLKELKLNTVFTQKRFLIIRKKVKLIKFFSLALDYHYLLSENNCCTVNIFPTRVHENPD